MSPDPLTIPLRITPYYVERPNPRAAYIPPSIPPASTSAVEVCPHCKCALIAPAQCREHGSIVPMRSAVVNPSFY